MAGIYEAARTGDARALYAALRDDMARTLDEGVPPRDYAAIAKSLIQVVEKLGEGAPDASAAAPARKNRIAEARKKFQVVA